MSEKDTIGDNADAPLHTMQKEDATQTYSGNLDFPEEVAGEVVTEFVDHCVQRAQDAKMRLSIIADEVTQREMEFFLCCAVRSCETTLTGKDLFNFLDAACAAFMTEKLCRRQ